MSFKTFLKEQKSPPAEVETEILEEEEVKAFNVIEIKKTWVDRLGLYGRKLFDRKAVRLPFKKEVFFLGEDTILIKTNKFPEAIQTAKRYFSNKGRSFSISNLTWRHVYAQTTREEMPPQNRNKQSFIGFKFFLRDSKKNEISNLDKFLKQRKLLAKLDNYFLTRAEGDERYIKLLSIINQNENFTIEMLYNVCEDMGVRTSKEIIMRILEGRNNWVHVGTVEKAAYEKPRVNIYANESETELYLEIQAPKKSAIKLNLTRIEEMLTERNIYAPLIEEGVERYLAERDWGKAIKIAQGVPMQAGQSAYIENVAEDKHFNEQQKQLQSGKSEQRVISRVISVRAGEVIAKKHPLIKGKNGKSIYGKTIEVDEVEDIPFLAGLHTALDKDGLVLTAEIDGSLYRGSNGAWSVGEVLELDQVNRSTGNVSHLGTVIVYGPVEDGYNVVASGSIEVHGTVGIATLEAGSDITLHKGINGKNRATITSHFGSIRAKYLSDVRVLAEGNIYVESLISNCMIEGGNKLEVQSIRGTIWGGRISMTESIVTANIGSVSGRKTEVTLGVPFALRAKLHSIKQDVERKKKQLVIEQREYSKQNLSGQTTLMKETKSNIRKIKESLSAIEEKRTEITNSIEESYVPCSLTVRFYIHTNVYLKCQAAEIHNRRYRSSLIFTTHKDRHDKLKVEPYTFNLKEKDKEVII